jgi:hypothetical protein
MSEDIRTQRIRKRIGKYKRNVDALAPDVQQKLHSIGWDMIDSSSPIQPSPKEVQSKTHRRRRKKRQRQHADAKSQSNEIRYVLRI